MGKQEGKEAQAAASPPGKTVGANKERWAPGDSELTPTKQIIDGLKLRPVACYTQCGDTGSQESGGGHGQNLPSLG